MVWEELVGQALQGGSCQSRGFIETQMCVARHCVYVYMYMYIYTYYIYMRVCVCVMNEQIIH